MSKSKQKSAPSFDVAHELPDIALEQTITWNSSQHNLPETFQPVLVAAYNKSLNRTVATMAMYEGTHGDKQHWSFHALVEDKQKWYIPDPSWLVTYWAEIVMPETIVLINESRKVLFW